MEDFRFNFVNITAFRLVDPNDVFVKNIINDIEKHDEKLTLKREKITLDVCT